MRYCPSWELIWEKWCGDCMANPKLRCDARAQYLVGKWAISENKAKVNLMKDGLCRKQYDQSTEKINEEREPDLEKWCGDCMASADLQCDASSLSWKSGHSQKRRRSWV